MNNEIFDSHGIKPYGAVPNETQFAHFHYKKAFFHFGVNTFSNTEWGDGSRIEACFNPTELDCRQWVRVAKAAGFDLVMITAKHHDGFCLWPSKYTEYTVKNAPWKNGKGDVIREFTDAAHEYGLRVGLYISPWDKNSPYWGSDEYSTHYAKQLKELLTNYGRIDELWWDGAGSRDTPYRWGEWAELIRKYQPNAAIFGSMGASDYVDLRWVGNEEGRAGETYYSSLDIQDLFVEDMEKINVGKRGEAHFIPAECDLSIRPGWFYHEDQNCRVRSVANLNKYWFTSVGRGAMYLLNFPPDTRGLILDTDARHAILSHRCIQKMLAVNFACGARITADSVLDDCLPEKAALPDENLFYAATESTCVLDIILPRPEKMNVLLLGEEIRLGERIGAFRLERIDENGTATLLVRGTSVGFTKALRFPVGEYSHLRLTVEEAAAQVVLSRLGLHFFDDAFEEAATPTGTENLAELSTSHIDIAPDRKLATVAFGGIYPFDKIYFNTDRACRYSVEAFNGSSWYQLATGETDGMNASVFLDKPVTGSYQIRITSSEPFYWKPDFDVR